MRVKTLSIFHDLKEDVIRQEGDEFEVTQKRFNEIDKVLPGYLEVIDKPKRAKKVAEDAEA